MRRTVGVSLVTGLEVEFIEPDALATSGEIDPRASHMATLRRVVYPRPRSRGGFESRP